MTTSEIVARHVVSVPPGVVEYVQYNWSSDWFAQRFIPKGKKAWWQTERLIRNGKRSCRMVNILDRLWQTMPDYMMQHHIEWEAEEQTAASELARLRLK